MAQQWDTSSAAGMNIVTHIPTGFQLAFIALDIESGEVTGSFGFDVGQPYADPPVHKKHRNVGVGQVVRAGSHGPALDFARLDLKINGRQFSLEMADDDGVLLWQAVPGETGRAPTMTFAVFSQPGNSDVQFRVADSGVGVSLPGWAGFIRCGFSLDGYGTFTSRDNLERYLRKSRRLNYSHAARGLLCLALPADEAGRMVVALGKSDRETARAAGLTMSRYETIRTRLRDDYAKRRVNGQPAEIGDCVRGLTDCVYWNTIREDASGSRTTLVNREWVQMMEDVYTLPRGTAGGRLIFNWDAAFHAMLACWECPDLARESVMNTLSGQDSGGRVPQVRIGQLAGDRSNPPVLALAAWKIYQCTGDRNFLKEVYGPLARWYGWFERNRRGPGDILWSWGAEDGEAAAAPEMRLSGAAGARYESGMDDNPMWDFLPFDPDTERLSAACIDLSSFMILFIRILMAMAEALDIEADVDRYRDLYAKEASICESWLWDERSAFYFSRFSDGRWIHVPVISGFYPLLAGTPSRKRAARLIENNLFNEDRFGGSFTLPTVARSASEYYPDGDYWRGRIWPPANYLTFLGLRNYDSRAAHHLAAASAELFLREYRGQGHVHENYSALTGYGEPQPGIYARSCPYYTWGGLMGLMLVEELFDTELFGPGLRFGSRIYDQPVSVRNLRYRGSRYSLVTSVSETVLSRDGKLLFKSKPGCLVRALHQASNELTFRIEQGAPAHITLAAPVRPERLQVAAGGKPVSVVLVSEREIAFKVEHNNDQIAITWQPS